MRGMERQTSVYLAGVSGVRPKVPVDPAALEQAALGVLPDEAAAYISAGAGARETMGANRAGFTDWRIVPRVLRDTSARDPGTELFGRRSPGPLLTAPIGVLELAHREADLAVARGAAAAGVPMIISNQASTPMEEIAAELGDSPRWFQLYWSSSDEVVESFVERAERCGCEAIVVTLDTTQLGWRPRDLDLAYLPFLRGKGIAQYTSDPAFNRLVKEDAAQAGEAPRPRPTPTAIRTLIELTRSRASRAQVQTFIRTYSRPSLAWENLAFLRERTKLPIILKGILHPDDAERAIAEGMDGVLVSNHGGRQVDGAIGAVEALPAVAERVGGRVPVLIDSGVRGGADVFKALALGADAVLVGRPYVYGLALAGAEGVREVLQNFQAEVDLTMGLTGVSSVEEIGRDALVRAPVR
ncbi:MAG: alpha-hydroxy-acid oxidizing protein [Thermoleophilaceae bacterium]|nr:alpha-hydroxy-acid oxidizing protein [Thermoleophilaceae bacterium]